MSEKIILMNGKRRTLQRRDRYPTYKGLPVMYCGRHTRHNEHAYTREQHYVTRPTERTRMWCFGTYIDDHRLHQTWGGERIWPWS